MLSTLYIHDTGDPDMKGWVCSELEKCTYVSRKEKSHEIYISGIPM